MNSKTLNKLISALNEALNPMIITSREPNLFRVIHFFSLMIIVGISLTTIIVKMPYMLFILPFVVPAIVFLKNYLKKDDLS